MASMAQTGEVAGAAMKGFLILCLALVLTLFPFRIAWLLQAAMLTGITWLWNGAVLTLAVLVNGLTLALLGPLSRAIDTVMAVIAYWVNLLIIKPLNNILQTIFAVQDLLGLPVPQLTELSFPTITDKIQYFLMTPELYYLDFTVFIPPWPQTDVADILASLLHQTFVQKTAKCAGIPGETRVSIDLRSLINWSAVVGAILGGLATLLLMAAISLAWYACRGRYTSAVKANPGRTPTYTRLVVFLAGLILALGGVWFSQALGVGPGWFWLAGALLILLSLWGVAYRRKRGGE